MFNSCDGGKSYVDLFSFIFYNECMEDLLACSVVADSLRFTSALSVALAVVFLVIAVGIAVVKIFSGGIAMPRLFPVTTDVASFFRLFTVVPVFVTAYICHYNGMQVIQPLCQAYFSLAILVLMFLYASFYFLESQMVALCEFNSTDNCALFLLQFTA